MLCDKCKKREATMHIVQLNGDKRTEHYFCKECAAEFSNFILKKKKEKIPEEVSLGNLLNNLFSNLNLSALSLPDSEMMQATCPHCHTSYQEIIEHGKLGCPECYKKFAKQLAPLLKRLYGASEYKGKIPKRAKKKLRVSRDISRLREEIAACIAEESYEKAAKIRDEIKKLEAENIDSSEEE